MPVMSVLACQGALNYITGLVNAGGAGSLNIYTGAPPATTLTSDSGTLLATLAMSSTAFENATNETSNGLSTATANPISSDSSAAASGTAAHFRIKSGAGTVIFQGTCGTSSADLVMNTTSIAEGDTVACSAFLITLPCGDGVS